MEGSDDFTLVPEEVPAGENSYARADEVTSAEPVHEGAIIPEPREGMFHTESEVVDEILSKRDRLITEVARREEFVNGFGRRAVVAGAILAGCGIAMMLVIFIIIQAGGGYTGRGEFDAIMLGALFGLGTILIAPVFLYVKNRLFKHFLLLFLLPLAGTVGILAGMAASPRPSGEFAFLTAGMMIQMFMQVIVFISMGLLVLAGAYASAYARKYFPISPLPRTFGRVCSIFSLTLVTLTAGITILSLLFTSEKPENVEWYVYAILFLACMGVIIFTAIQILAAVGGDLRLTEQTIKRAEIVISLGYYLGFFIVALCLVGFYFAAEKAVKSANEDPIIGSLIFLSAGLSAGLFSGFIVMLSGYIGVLMDGAFSQWRSKVIIEVRRMEREIGIEEQRRLPRRRIIYRRS